MLPALTAKIRADKLPDVVLKYRRFERVIEPG
jgi:hypothetical protein